jgi:DUF1680 family protein
MSGAMAQTATSAASENWRDQGVLDLSKSPYARLRSVPVHAVSLQDGFWSRRRRTNVDDSIPTMRLALEEHGRMDNFRRLSGRSQAARRGRIASDSDVYKWLEGACFVLQSQENPDLRGQVEEIVTIIKGAQEPGGYLNTYYVDDHIAERMTPVAQETGHELYCMGHMLQGAIAYYRTTGSRELIGVGQSFLDKFLIPAYGPENTKRPIVSGHPEIEMSLVELYRTTGERRYLDLAGYILQGDPRITMTPEQISNLYCGIPFTTRTQLEGAHAVRALYACCGATDYYLETGDPAYLKTLELLSADLHDRQMYITGGVGAHSQGESFGDDYELPNARAYCESCGAIASMMWNWRLLAATGDARFTDMMERALYNGVNSGMSLDGKTYCYRNPLAYDPSWDTGDRHTPKGQLRNAWYDTTCCPPNLERTFASLPGYFYSTSKEGLYIHLYDNSDLNWRLESGNSIRLRQTTRYPWNGDIRIAVTPATPEVFTVFVRIPGWSGNSSVKVNGVPVKGVRAGTYLPIARQWSANDVIEIGLDMKPQMIRANQAVAEDTGRVAFQRGPVVYCMEGPDQTRQDSKSMAAYSIRESGETTSRFEADLLDGVVVLTHSADLHEPGESLYERALPGEDVASSTSVELMPYYSWANRAKLPMQVWIPLDHSNGSRSVARGSEPTAEPLPSNSAGE